MKIRNKKHNKVKWIKSRLGDAILRCDQLGPDGEILKTEIVMFVPKPVPPVDIE